VVFFYSKTGGKEWGIYGWAVIDRYDPTENALYFTPATPTNHLKMDPWPVGEEIINDIRGNMPRPTLFQVSPETARDIARGIKRWLSGTAEEEAVATT
jgi:hypothetical protein